VFRRSVISTGSCSARLREPSPFDSDQRSIRPAMAASAFARFRSAHEHWTKPFSPGRGVRINMRPLQHAAMVWTGARGHCTPRAVMGRYWVADKKTSTVAMNSVISRNARPLTRVPIRISFNVPADLSSFLMTPRLGRRPSLHPLDRGKSPRCPSFWYRSLCKIGHAKPCSRLLSQR